MVVRVSMDEVRKRKSGNKMGIIGSRPTPLKVSKDSNPNCIKIKPVIIYLRSPEVIHTQPKDFMALVQRLTGCSSSSSSSCTQPRKDCTSLQTNPLSFYPLEKQDTAYQTTSPPPEWANDYISQVISPPWNSFAEESELGMIWDPQLQLLSSPSFQLLQFPFRELEPFNYLCDMENPNIHGVLL
ncbi:hypothetical protein SUGI_1163510 [Cryptomeria japonica]|nr:hypothetical protein SUGI_1163510 [Cryptomeria japonica]